MTNNNTNNMGTYMPPLDPEQQNQPQPGTEQQNQPQPGTEQQNHLISLGSTAMAALLKSDTFWDLVDMELKRIIEQQDLTFWEKFKGFWRNVFLAITKTSALLSLLPVKRSYLNNQLSGESIFSMLTNKDLIESLEKKNSKINQILEKRLGFKTEITNALIKILKDKDLKNNIRQETVTLLDAIFKNKSKEEISILSTSLSVKILKSSNADSIQEFIKATAQSLKSIKEEAEAKKFAELLIPIEANATDSEELIAQRKLIAAALPKSGTLLEAASTSLKDSTIREAAAGFFVNKTEALENTQEAEETPTPNGPSTEASTNLAMVALSEQAQPLRNAILEITSDPELIHTAQETLPTIFFPKKEQETEEEQKDREIKKALIIAIVPHAAGIVSTTLEALNELEVSQQTSDLIEQFRNDNLDATVTAAKLFASPALDDTREKVAETLEDPKVTEATCRALPRIMTRITGKRQPQPTEAEIQDIQYNTKKLLQDTDILPNFMRNPKPLITIAEATTKYDPVPQIVQAITEVEQNEELKKSIEAGAEKIASLTEALAKTVMKDQMEELNLDPELLQILGIALQDTSLISDLLTGITTNNTGKLLSTVSKLLLSDTEHAQKMRTFMANDNFPKQVSAAIARAIFISPNISLMKNAAQITQNAHDYKEFLESYQKHTTLINGIKGPVSEILKDPNSELYKYLQKNLGDLTQIRSASFESPDHLDVAQILNSCSLPVLQAIIDKINAQEKDAKKEQLKRFFEEKQRAEQALQTTLTTTVKSVFLTLEKHKTELNNLLEPFIKLEKKNTAIKEEWLKTHVLKNMEIKGLVSQKLNIPLDEITEEKLLPHIAEITQLTNKYEIPRLHLKYLTRPELLKLTIDALTYLKANPELSTHLNEIIKHANFQDSMLIQFMQTLLQKLKGVINVENLSYMAEQFYPLTEALFGQKPWTKAAITIAQEIPRLSFNAAKSAASTVYRASTNYLTGKTQPEKDVSIDTPQKLTSKITDHLCIELFGTKANSESDRRNQDRKTLEKFLEPIMNKLSKDYPEKIYDLSENIHAVIGQKLDRKARLAGKTVQESIANMIYQNATKNTWVGIATGGIQINEAALNDDLANSIRAYLEQQVSNPQKAKKPITHTSNPHPSRNL